MLKSIQCEGSLLSYSQVGYFWHTRVDAPMKSKLQEFWEARCNFKRKLKPLLEYFSMPGAFSRADVYYEISAVNEAVEMLIDIMQGKE